MNIKQTLSIEDFIYMENLEKRYYGDKYITSFEDSYDWYKNLPSSIMVVEEQGKIIGFMNLFPIKTSIFEKIRKGVFNDKYLTYKDIVNISDDGVESINLFLSCIVIDEDYRGSSALKVLLKSYAEHYSKIQEIGIKINYIITDNVTDKGVNFSKKIGFKKLVETDHDSHVYIGSFETFIKRVKEIIE